MNDPFALLERIEDLTSQRVHARTECPAPLYERLAGGTIRWVSEHSAWLSARVGDKVRRIR